MTFENSSIPLCCSIDSTGKTGGLFTYISQKGSKMKEISTVELGTSPSLYFIPCHEQTLALSFVESTISYIVGGWTGSVTFS